jgi:hypothetical protein
VAERSRDGRARRGVGGRDHRAGRLKARRGGRGPGQVVLSRYRAHLARQRVRGVRLRRNATPASSTPWCTIASSV